MYQVKRHSTSHFVPLRGHHYHVREWGNPQSSLPPVVLAHGWMDVAASWQFMVESLTETFFNNRRILAADWRGYGLTTGPATDSYWLPDYLGDLDALLRHLCPDQPIDLVGHSMGGNVVMMYAGVRPARIRRLVNLEGFGMPQTVPAMAPKRYAQWLDELQALDQGELNFKPYADLEGVAKRLQKTNPRLRLDHAQFLAHHWAQPTHEGQWELLGHPAHKLVNPNLYQVEEMLALYRSITAPTLCVLAEDNEMRTWWKGRYTLDEFKTRIAQVPNLQTLSLPDCGHMLHHDQPQALAQALSQFLYTDA